MRRRVRLAAACCLVLLAGCGSDAGAPEARPSSSATSSAPAAPGLRLPGDGEVVRAFAPDGWPVFVVGRGEGRADVFGAIAEVGPDRLGDEVGWCHVNHMFEATTRGRRYDATGRSVTGQGGLVRYAAEVVDGTVRIGARGEVVTGKAEGATPLPCARRALLTPDYPAPVTLAAAAKGGDRPVRVSAVAVLDGRAHLCPADRDCPGPGTLPVGESMDAERGARSRVALARTFWVLVRDGVAVDVAYGSVPPPDDDVSEETQFGYLTRVEGDWIYFDRAEILLGEAAVAAAKADGKPVPEDGEHYLRNRNPRLRRYRVDAQTQVNTGDFSGTGTAALPRLRARAGPDFSLTLVTRNGRLLQVNEELCGEGE